jgi:hypothetical protein
MAVYQTFSLYSPEPFYDTLFSLAHEWSFWFDLFILKTEFRVPYPNLSFPWCPVFRTMYGK